jgi:hypothetical protein
MPKDNDRSCGNCAWGFLFGEDQICLSKFKEPCHLGQPAVDDGEVWCVDWNMRPGNEALTVRYRGLWRKTDEPVVILEEVQRELFGDLSKLGKEE